MAVLPTVSNLRGVLQKVIFVPIVYGFISLLPVFLTGWENSDRIADRLFSIVRSKENTFDFVIVGGGTAGALVASRLSEHYKVLLLEAGGTPNPFQTIPALALKLLNNPQTDWSHKTVPQRRACLNSINQQSSWSAGRNLGGTSNINFMTHMRGSPMDYENWASITGDPSWGYAGVLPFFKRSETFSGTTNDPEARGHAGELKIRKPSYSGLSEDWIRAGQEAGFPFVDLNGRHEEGFGIIQYPIYKGIRQSTYSAFLLPYHKSPRLTIRRYSLVRKILFRDMNNMAYGVEYVRHGRIETAIATKEVIISAGTLGSAKLLMLSGVGPRGHLEELGIPVRSDLPVGRNLQDHLAVQLGPFFIKEAKSFLFDRDVRPENILRWLFLGTGPITTTGYQGAASIASSAAKSRAEGNWPDLHLILHGQAIHQGYVDHFAYAYSLQEDELMQYYSNAVGRDSFHILIMGSRPTSTGQVLLSGSSISDPLVINPRYLEDNGDGDFKVLLEGVKASMAIAHNTSVFRRLGTEFTSAKLPGCHQHDHHTDAYWDCYIRRYTLSAHNPVGTVALGHVLDSYLRVRGTRGLRVVDASIQPTIVSTGTSASTLMIGEKGADMILKDHGIPERDTDFYDLIFGRNGFIKTNPFLRILQREFDTLNPLRALFRPFTAGRDKEAEEKERFTRNGRVDNPFLQVISTVFGNGPGPAPVGTRQDVGVSESSNVEVIASAVGTTAPVLQNVTVTHKILQLEEEEGLSKSNVISKNQWVLETPPGASSPRGVGDKNVGGGTSIKFVSETGKVVIPIQKQKKGGKRYALLQEILKKLNKSENVVSTVSPPFQTSIEKPTTSKGQAENEVDVGLVVKPVELGQATAVKLNNPFSTGNLFQFGNWNSFGGGKDDPKSKTSTTTLSPLADLLKSLNTFENFMHSLSSRSSNAQGFTTLPPPFLFPTAKAESSTSDNIFTNFLSAFNTTGGGLNKTQGNANNPFQFLFGKPFTTVPTTTAPPPPLAQSNKVNTNFFGGNNALGDNMFSSWLKGTQSGQTTTQSPFANWFKPFNFVQTPATSSSWFKPFFPPPTTTTTTTTTPPPPPNPLKDFVDLFLGDLNTNERNKMSQTLGAMFPGHNIMDFVGSTKKPKQTSLLDLFQQPPATDNNLGGGTSSSENSQNNIFNFGGGLSNNAGGGLGGGGPDVLQTLLTLGNLMSHFQPTTEKPPNIFDNILSAFNPSSTTTTKKPSFLDILMSGR